MRHPARLALVPALCVALVVGCVSAESASDADILAAAPQGTADLPAEKPAAEPTPDVAMKSADSPTQPATTAAAAASSSGAVEMGGRVAAAPRPAEPPPPPAPRAAGASRAGSDPMLNFAPAGPRGGERAMRKESTRRSRPMKKPAPRTRSYRDSDPVLDGALGMRSVSDRKAERKVKRKVATRPTPPAEKPPSVARADDGDGRIVHAGVNPLVDTRKDKLSTFAIDVDTASYFFSKRYLEHGQRPPAGAVRVEEWVNAFHYDYEGPGKGAPFAIHLDGAPSPFHNDRHLVRVGIQGQRIKASKRKPVHLTFLVDVSGSMSRQDKLPLAQRSLHLLTDQLTHKDSVSLITYAGRTGEVLPATKASASGKAKIHRAIDMLRSSGGTNMSSGMDLAYRNAGKYLSSNTVSRVIVLSDGDANIGRTSHQEILKGIKGYVSEGVTLSTVGFGTGNYRDNLMEQLANAGNGNYSYVDSDKTARKVFVKDLTGTLQVIAKDVKIQVEFDPRVVKRYRLIGYENRDIADRDFRNDKVDAGEIGAGHTVTALYEVELTQPRTSPRDMGRLGTVRIRHKTPRGYKATELARALKGTHMRERFGDLDDNTRFASAAALASEILRGSEHASHLSLEDAVHLASEAVEGPFADERREFIQLLSRTAQRESVAFVR
jgi:Ca-activated chloride channel family protein